MNYTWLDHFCWRVAEVWWVQWVKRDTWGASMSEGPAGSQFDTCISAPKPWNSLQGYFASASTLTLLLGCLQLQQSNIVVSEVKRRCSQACLSPRVCMKDTTGARQGIFSKMFFSTQTLMAPSWLSCAGEAFLSCHSSLGVWSSFTVWFCGFWPCTRGEMQSILWSLWYFVAAPRRCAFTDSFELRGI